MKAALVVILLAASALAQDISTAAAESACGPSDSQFAIKTKVGDHPLAQTDPGRALVYVIEEQKFRAFRDVTARVGLDGSWVGANRGNSYLFFPVDPGEHHLCTDWISEWLPGGRLVSLANFTAEPGKIYYFRARTTGGPSAIGDGKWEAADGASIDLDLVNSDEGKLMIARSVLSVSHPKK
jgi:hypothetical protein